MESNQKLYERAVKQWGTKAQMIMAIEEMSELTTAISKHLRIRNRRRDITEEMADVEIMLEQLKVMFRNKNEIKVIKARKLKRVRELLDLQDKEIIQKYKKKKISC